jgi:hypothetical protein
VTPCSLVHGNQDETWRWRWYIPPKPTRLDGAITQMTTIHIITAVKSYRSLKYLATMIMVPVTNATILYRGCHKKWAISFVEHSLLLKNPGKNWRFHQWTFETLLKHVNNWSVYFLNCTWRADGPYSLSVCPPQQGRALLPRRTTGKCVRTAPPVGTCLTGLPWTRCGSLQHNRNACCISRNSGL